MIREQMAGKITSHTIGRNFHDLDKEERDYFLSLTDQILFLLCAEIEKMGLSPEEMHGLDVSSDAIGEDFWNEVAQAQLQKILNKLKEEK